MSVRIPHSSPNRGERTYAHLVFAVPRSQARIPLLPGNVYFRTGTWVEVPALRPSPQYPETPMLVEYAGRDRTGLKRSQHGAKDVRILWRFNAARADWDQIARVSAHGPEWYYHLVPIIRREIAEQRKGRPPAIAREEAHRAAASVLDFLDGQLDTLDDGEQVHALCALHNQFTARLVEARAA